MAAHSHESFTLNAERAVFAARRCDWLDCFAELESQVCALLKEIGRLDGGNKPFAQRLRDLRELTPCPQLSKEKAKSLQMLATECECLLPIRAAIVHSVMQVGSREGQPVAFFHNSCEVGRGSPLCVVLTVAGVDGMLKRLKELTALATL